MSPEPVKPSPLSADLHIHSALSGCAEDRMSPNEIITRVIGLGTDVFSITDHNSGFNCAAFDAAARERGVLFIPGIELQSSEEVHLLGYFPDLGTLEDFEASIVRPGLMKGMKNDPQRFGNQLRFGKSGGVIGEDEGMLSMPLSLSVDELVNGIHDRGGVAAAAHIDRGFSVVSQLGFIPPELELDAVEIRDLTKLDEVKNNHLRGKDLTIITSSDSHYLDMMKKPAMRLRPEDASAGAILDCIRRDGPGRVTLLESAGRAPKPRDAVVKGDKSGKDWKSLYG